MAGWKVKRLLPGCHHDLRRNEPRYASLPKIMKASQAGAKSPAFRRRYRPRLETLKVVEPSKRTAGIKVASVDELVSKLKTLGVVA